MWSLVVLGARYKSTSQKSLNDESIFVRVKSPLMWALSRLFLAENHSGGFHSGKRQKCFIHFSHSRDRVDEDEEEQGKRDAKGRSGNGRSPCGHRLANHSFGYAPNLLGHQRGGIGGL